MDGTTFTYEMESEIRGFHVYGKAWRPTIGDLLSTDWELANEDDKFAVCVYRTNHNENELVGHLPAEFSRIAAYFIQNGGEIFCKVTGKRVHSKGPRGGLAIPCKLRWTSSNKKHVRRLNKLIATETSKILQRYGLVYC